MLAIRTTDKSYCVVAGSKMKQPTRTVMLTLLVLPILIQDWTAPQSLILEGKPPDRHQPFFSPSQTETRMSLLAWGFSVHPLSPKLTFEKKLTVLV